MSLNELASSQLEQAGPTPDESENAMVNENEEQASETSVNSDGNDDQNIDPEQQEQQEQTILKDKTQKRINGLIGSNKEMEEKIIRLEADKDAYEKYNQSKEQTLQDHSVETLTTFVAQNQDDPELAAQVAQAKEIIIEKKIDAKVNALFEKETATTNKKQGEELTNVMIQNISGDRLNDANGDYYATASQYLYDLGQPQYTGINKDQLIATLLAERDFQMKQTKGPNMNDRIKQNQNNTIKANSRQSPGGGSDLATYLAESGGSLSRSSITKPGTTNEAIRKLKMFDNFEGG